MKMEWGKTLFDDDTHGKESAEKTKTDSSKIYREVQALDRLKNLEEKITTAVERVKALKEEKIDLEKKIKKLEGLLEEKSQEVETLKSEKSSIGFQLEELLNELETIDI
jgi:predicted  nucleic acid-binding Zn-ribbon protein